MLYCICFMAVIVWLNITADWSFQNLLLEQLYNINAESIAPTRPQCAALLGIDINDLKVPSPECNGLFYLLLAGKLSASTLILKILNVVFIIACVLTGYQFYRIYRSHAASRIPVGLCMVPLVICYYLHSAGTFWERAPGVSYEGHFARVGATLPAEALRTFCNVKAPLLERSADSIKQADDATTVAFKDRNKNRFDTELTKHNILCPQGIDQVERLFFISLFVGVAMVALAMGAGAVGFNDLTRPSSNLLADRHLATRPLSSAEDLLVEYRKRLEDARTLLYFGSSILVLGIAWMAAHAKWASPILTLLWGNDSFSMINGYITYLVILYLTLLSARMYLKHSFCSIR